MGAIAPIPLRLIQAAIARRRLHVRRAQAIIAASPATVPAAAAKAIRAIVPAEAIRAIVLTAVAKEIRAIVLMAEAIRAIKAIAPMTEAIRATMATAPMAEATRAIMASSQGTMDISLVITVVETTASSQDISPVTSPGTMATDMVLSPDMDTYTMAPLIVQ